MENAAESGRRQLQFDDWEAVERDLDSLLLGYEQHGSWNLSQAALHLDNWLSFPMDGFPKAPFPISLILAAIRITSGKKMLAATLAKKAMNDGGPTSPETIHAEDETTDQVAVDKLRATIRRFRDFDGPIIRSPVYGDMDKSTAEQLQFVHFSHHLSWLVPNSLAE